MPLKALLLSSGGRDSRLAAEALRRYGWSVRCLHLDTGFVKGERTEALEEGTERLDVFRDYVDQVLTAPRHGFGVAMNPCLDCRAFMLRQADARAREAGIEILATGDVLGQRGVDQSRHALRIVDEEAGVSGRVIRPLSADRLVADGLSRPFEGEAPLGRLHGRARREQAELARRWQLEPLPTPSGGCCLLADRRFAVLLRDLLEHRDPDAVRREDVERLRIGRHFRLSWNLKLIVARDAGESDALCRDPGAGWLLHAVDGRGPWALAEGEVAGPSGERAASVVARYAGANDGVVRTVRLRKAERSFEVAVEPASAEQVERWRLAVL